MGKTFFFGDHSDVSDYVSPLITIDTVQHREKLLPVTGQKKAMAEEESGFMYELTEDLKEAIRVFFIATAIRFYRGDEKKHHTMIINISHFADIQNKLKALTQPYIKQITEGIKATEKQDPNRACGDKKLGIYIRPLKNLFSS